MNQNNKSPLLLTLETARDMQKKALCLYSKFPVGAAIETTDGQVIGGFNIESASYGLTMCAERVALFSALSQGHHDYKHIVLVTETGSFPCGACRQMLYEFGLQAQITIATPKQIITSCSVQSLMPHAFNDHDLHRKS